MHRTASAVIVAGGKGMRMQGRIRKQYRALSGTPVLLRTLQKFDACPSVDEMILVVPADDLDFCKSTLLTGAVFEKRLIMIGGGDERQDSVYNGIRAVNGRDGIVVIHDGVRPFVRIRQIESCIDGAADFGACILGVPAVDTLKRVNEGGVAEDTLWRDSVWLAQTPQAFQYPVILRAHEAARADNFIGTDDASLVERLNMPVKVVFGSRLNIKITTKDDLVLAEAIARMQTDETIASH